MGGRRRVSETQLPQRSRLQRVLWWVARYMIIAAALMGASKLLEQLNQPVFAALEYEQSLALAAVAGINPPDIFHRYVCALMPSVEQTNREIQAKHPSPRYGFLGHAPLESDCRYQLSPVKPAPGGLPPPVVGHWADGMTSGAGLTNFFVALLDTGWHLVVQSSVFASIFSIFAFVTGGVAAGLLMGMVRFVWPAPLAPVVFALGTIAATYFVALVLRGAMQGGLDVFGDITRLAGICCTAPGILRVAYDYVLELIKTGFHSGVEHVIPR